MVFYDARDRRDWATPTSRLLARVWLLQDWYENLDRGDQNFIKAGLFAVVVLPAAVGIACRFVF